ncbi:Protein LIPS-15 [Aphelenchoides avenae]|nr:Protein LIPS-15 [Aphelenchus avenae]
MASISVALVAICLPLTVFATISQDFQDFIKKEYGESALKQLSRLDLGEQGSFGGGTHKAGEKTSKTPVIFVHGVTHYAGKLSAHRQYFLQHGYKEEEVYAPTFGGAGKVIMIYETMTCDKVKTVRAFIEAVWAYTNSTVDVVAYSQGVPISRKAILGGKCVDTGEDIGPPMTSLVRTYIGVAGPNNGCKVCYMTFGSCNTQNGLHCTSKFLADINSKYVRESS